MSNLFDRLAARARGDGEAIRPRIAARFEPVHGAQPERAPRALGRHVHALAPPPPGMLHCAPPSTVRIVPVVNEDASVAK